jgi:hypothetical protein
MEPNSWERECIEEVKAKFPTEAERWEKYGKDAEQMYTGKEDVAAAKKRLKEKRAEIDKEKANGTFSPVSNVVAADYMAEHLKDGYEFPKTAEAQAKVAASARKEAVDALKLRKASKAKNGKVR